MLYITNAVAFLYGPQVRGSLVVDKTYNSPTRGTLSIKAFPQLTHILAAPLPCIIIIK